ncbi:hypothetical protein b3_0016 [Synechococcus phage B3]|jgi:hypothetical protein|nr:hypothetical protein b3_0016 [Synechococcus phage B3]QGT54644.1 hypothetical protein b23_0016 [Synechococcus phage B23]
MKITTETHQELFELQEDMASHFTTEHFPISGEAYWAVVECIAIAKLAELRGQLDSSHTVH